MSTTYTMEDTIQKKSTLQTIRDSIDELNIKLCTANPNIYTALEYFVPIAIVILLDLTL